MQQNDRFGFPMREEELNLKNETKDMSKAPLRTLHNKTHLSIFLLDLVPVLGDLQIVGTWMIAGAATSSTFSIFIFRFFLVVATSTSFKVSSMGAAMAGVFFFRFCFLVLTIQNKFLRSTSVEAPGLMVP